MTLSYIWSITGVPYPWPDCIHFLQSIIWMFKHMIMPVSTYSCLMILKLELFIFVVVCLFVVLFMSFFV